MWFISHFSTGDRRMETRPTAPCEAAVWGREDLRREGAEQGSEKTGSDGYLESVGSVAVHVAFMKIIITTDRRVHDAQCSPVVPTPRTSRSDDGLRRDYTDRRRGCCAILHTFARHDHVPFEKADWVPRCSWRQGLWGPQQVCQQVWVEPGYYDYGQGYGIGGGWTTAVITMIRMMKTTRIR